jgi:predicted DNA-binding antitoxin AbrB/MazE fold protein
MTHYLKAIYEDGVFRPLEPVQIAEHQEVSLLVETPDEPRDEADTDLPIWEFAAQLMRDAPEDVLQVLPTDGASQHDHYLYGTPKQPCRAH